MSDEPLHQPNDKLFKLGFTDLATAIAFFLAYLPALWLREFDFSKAELMPGSFVDDLFKATESDLLFRVALVGGGEAYIYLLFEHQTKKDPWLALRLLGYMQRIWERCRREQETAGEPPRLPVIIPLVLAQTAGGWPEPTNFGALFGLSSAQREEFSSVIPEFDFQLVELARLPYDQITGTPMGVMTLRILKAQSEDGLWNAEVWEAQSWDELGNRERSLLLRYIFHQQDFDKETLLAKVKALKAPRLRESAMSTAEQLIEEGRREAMSTAEQLIREGRQEAMNTAEQLIREGRQEGRSEGRSEGRLIGQIQLLQSLLHESESSPEWLALKSEAELRTLSEELRRKLPL